MLFANWMKTFVVISLVVNSGAEGPLEQSIDHINLELPQKSMLVMLIFQGRLLFFLLQLQK